MKIKAFWLVAFAMLSMIFSAPRYPELISLLLDFICFLLAAHVYSFVIEDEKDCLEDTPMMNFNLKVMMHHHKDEYLWEYVDNVVPLVGHRMVLKSERGVETYAVQSVFQSITRNVEVYVEPIE